MDENQAPDAPLRLPAELTIYTVGELHPQWLAWLGRLAGQAATSPSAAPVAAVEAGAVDQADAAGVQLLLALQHALAERGQGLALQQPSAALHEACSALGLQHWLSQHSTGVAA